MSSSDQDTYYLLKKRGMFYRPNSHGYTYNILAAGLYSEEEVRGYRNNPHLEVRVIDVSTKKREMIKLYNQARHNMAILSRQLGYHPHDFGDAIDTVEEDSNEF